ncbi:hypothetical protein [Frigidibacter sp. ROC022]|uniref:hypothetical protein n=1 Tax=Frigidibacter sp. ROC022 TaxID=2971796 RepID=UPI00215B73BA|nr:hypothetical protein [Frigidibacter sp. ROC022]MCR8726605.1 hypothetical protein [Frigidibacter sp. ROC022]
MTDPQAPVTTDAEIPDIWGRLLRPGETILWHGRPDMSVAAPRAVGVVRGFGWALLLIGLGVWAILWANRAELGGSTGLAIVFGSLPMLVALGFLVGIPMLNRSQRRKTRYAVTDRFAAICSPGGAHFYPLGEEAEPRAEDLGKRGWQALWGYNIALVRTGNDVPGMRAPVRRLLGFPGLRQADAEAAAAALRAARGKGGTKTETRKPA